MGAGTERGPPCTGHGLMRAGLQTDMGTTDVELDLHPQAAMCDYLRRALTRRYLIYRRRAAWRLTQR